MRFLKSLNRVASLRWWQVVAVIAILIASINLGCNTSSTEQQAQKIQAVGVLNITGNYEVAPGKYIVSNWSGEELMLEFTLVNRAQDRCFSVDDGYNLVCLQPGYSKVISWPYRGEDTSFTIKEIGQGNMQNELLCKVVGER